MAVTVHGAGPHLGSVWAHQSLPLQCCLWPYLLDGHRTYIVGSSCPGWNPQTYTIYFLKLLFQNLVSIPVPEPVPFCSRLAPWMGPGHGSSLPLSAPVNGTCCHHIALWDCTWWVRAQLATAREQLVLSAPSQKVRISTETCLIVQKPRNLTTFCNVSPC